MKSNATVNNSSRPNNIRKESNHLPAGEIAEKVWEGPISDIPGPTFPSDVATEEIATSKFSPKPVITTDPNTKTKR